MRRKQRIEQSWLAPLLACCGLALGGFALTACEEGPAEEAGEAVDEAVDDVEDAADDAVDAVEDAVDDATDPN
jgi:hypothetical protein